MRRYLLALVALACSLGTANAVPVLVDNWGPHGALEFHTSFNPPGTYDEVIKFTLPGTFDASASAVALRLLTPDGGTVILEGNGTVDLFKNQSAANTNYTDDGPSLGQFAFNAVQNGLAYLGLVSGAYYYLVHFNATGTGGGTYTLASSIINAIPIPPALFLFGSAVAGIGYLGMRRRKVGKPLSV